MKNEGVSSSIAETVCIFHPALKQNPTQEALRTPEDCLEEAEGLSHAIDLQIIHSEIVTLRTITPGYYFTKGQIEHCAEICEVLQPTIVMVNASLSPVQQRNLENALKTKVIDRTGLILEIFGARASTKEGRIQVDLAALGYQRSRLVRSWTHLERQRGGAGFMGGPGERQIEIDRRLIDQRIVRLKKQLETVRRTRELGRYNRTQVPYPIVALVGYTNAGKSTLFNTLTDADIFAEDLLFATLDPTMRQIMLSSGQKAILSDTVGFISDLPTHLIEAFRATLEQVTTADIIVHVMDAASPHYDAQREDVIAVLKDLGIDYANDDRILEVHNKIDLLSEEAINDVSRDIGHSDHAVMLSAVTGRNTDVLLEKIGKFLQKDQKKITVHVPVADGKALSWLYAHATIENQHDKNDIIIVDAIISNKEEGRFRAQFPKIKVKENDKS